MRSLELSQPGLDPRLPEIAVGPGLDRWLNSPAYREAQDGSGLASGPPAVEAVAKRLG